MQAYTHRLNTASVLPFTAVLLLALAAVAVRSFIGSVLPLPWKTGGLFLTLLPARAAFAGKAAGGFLGDVFGARIAGAGPLILSIPLLVFGNGSPWLSAAGIVLFNAAMPVMLCVVASKFPQHPGLAFGLTTLALLAGNVPAFFFRLSETAALITAAVLTAVSAVCIALAANNKRGETEHEKNRETFEPHAV